MFAILLPFILVFQANALATTPLDEPWVGDTKYEARSEARVEAMQQVIACGRAKLEGAGVPESQGNECAKEIATYNEVSAKAAQTDGR